MIKLISESDEKIIEKQLKNFEVTTGCDLLLVIAKNSDNYTSVTWKLTCLLTFLFLIPFSLFFDLAHSYYWPGLFLVTGHIFYFLMSRNIIREHLMPWFLTDVEIDKRCADLAIQCFYTLGVSQVHHKVTVMLMLSLLEKKITLLIDEKLKEKITQQELDDLVAAMKFSFRKGAMKDGITNCITQLEQKILLDFGGKVINSKGVELSDRIHFLN